MKQCIFGDLFDQLMQIVHASQYLLYELKMSLTYYYGSKLENNGD